MTDDRYSRELDKLRTTTHDEITKQKTLDGRDGQIAARLKLDGTTQMEGPLQLVDDTDPGVEHHAVPTGWVFDEAERVRTQADNAKQKSSNAHQKANRAISDFAKWLNS